MAVSGIVSLIAGLFIANYTVGDSHKAGWSWFAVFLVVFMLGNFILQRFVFRGAPAHIKFLY